MAGRDVQLGLRLAGRRASIRSQSFDLDRWSRAARFRIPEHARPLLERVASPAEACVVRELLDLPGALYDGGRTVRFRGAAIVLQVPCRGYRVDVAVKRDQTMLAMEIDGLAFHGLTQAQFARDYLRTRRLLLAGYIVIRFTATEAMSQPRQCWRDVFSVLRARRQIERLASRGQGRTGEDPRSA
jgi:very-short-patch-repair endonuclease